LLASVVLSPPEFFYRHLPAGTKTQRKKTEYITALQFQTTWQTLTIDHPLPSSARLELRSSCNKSSLRQTEVKSSRNLLRREWQQVSPRNGTLTTTTRRRRTRNTVSVSIQMSLFPTKDSLISLAKRKSSSEET
jgi:hypothetical protein